VKKVQYKRKTLIYNLEKTLTKPSSIFKKSIHINFKNRQGNYNSHMMGFCDVIRDNNGLSRIRIVLTRNLIRKKKINLLLALLFVEYYLKNIRGFFKIHVYPHTHQYFKKIYILNFFKIKL